MRNLSEQMATFLTDIREASAIEDRRPDGSVWGGVHLDEVNGYASTPLIFAGLLAVLTAKGLFEPSEEYPTIGFVRVDDAEASHDPT